MIPAELELNLMSKLSWTWRSSTLFNIREYLVFISLVITQEDQQGNAVEKKQVHAIERKRSVKAPQESRTGTREDAQGSGYL